MSYAVSIEIIPSSGTTLILRRVVEASSREAAIVLAVLQLNDVFGGRLTGLGAATIDTVEVMVAE